MPILLRIAVRNLLQHRGKTFIIGTIIALGVIVLIVGNALMDTAALGIQRAFIDNYTADIMISGTSQGEVSIFGVQTVGGIDPTPVIPEYSDVYEIAAGLPGIVSVTPQLTGFGLLRREADEDDSDSQAVQETSNSTVTLLFGIEPESYRRTFSNMRIIEGRYLGADETGILISVDRRRAMYKDYLEALEEGGAAPEEGTEAAAAETAETAGGMAEPAGTPPEAETADAEDDGPSDEELAAFLSVGDFVRVIGGIGQGLPRIRVLPIVGVYEQVNEAQGVGSDLITFIDAQSLRALLNLNVSAAESVVLAEEETELLRGFADAGDEAGIDFFSESLFASEDDFFLDTETSGDASAFSFDSLFSDTAAFDGTEAPGTAEAGTATEAPGTAETGTAAEAGDTAEAAAPAVPAPESGETAALSAAAETGVWHYILIRLEHPNAARRLVERLNLEFFDQGIDAEAGDWEKAAGPFAQTADVVRIVFNIAIIIIGVVAILIMMNTMVISVIERTNEIGTMRALGAQRGTIRGLFLWETLVITGVFGLAGIVLGSLTTGIINWVGIEATNTFLQVLFAGPVLRPRISVLSLFYSIGIIGGIGILAHLYPVSVAVKIPPVRAMQSE